MHEWSDDEVVGDGDAVDRDPDDAKDSDSPNTDSPVDDGSSTNVSNDPPPNTPPADDGTVATDGPANKPDDPPADEPPAPAPTGPMDNSPAHKGLSEAFVFIVRLANSAAGHLSGYANPMQGTAQSLANYLQAVVTRVEAAHAVTVNPQHPGSAGADAPGHAEPAQ